MQIESEKNWSVCSKTCLWEWFTLSQTHSHTTFMKTLRLPLCTVVRGGGLHFHCCSRTLSPVLTACRRVAVEACACICACIQVCVRVRVWEKESPRAHKSFWNWLCYYHTPMLSSADVFMGCLRELQQRCGTRAAFSGFYFPNQTLITNQCNRAT